MNIEELPWLPLPDADFRAATKALRTGPTWDPLVARALSTQRLGLDQLHALARAFRAAPAAASVSWTGVTLLSNATMDLVAPALAATGPRHDLWLSVHAAPFGVVAQECLDPGSATNARRDAYVILALDHRGLPLAPCVGDEAGADAAVAEAFDTVMRWAGSLRRQSGATVIVQTIAPPADRLFGSLDGSTPGTLRWLIDRYNDRLRSAREPGVLLLDTAALAEIVGLARWHDPVQWNIGKFPFAQRLVPLYAEWICRLVAAERGQSRKCLVLDLDNTLWGGVIGDEGLAGIVLGQGSPVGEAHLAVQAAALALRERGIVLAVSSKNDDAIARSAFREHPEMLLREQHIAVFQANWQDKASNLRTIAETLGIGIDALVLLDDNPAERAQVRAALPAVAVPELPPDPEFFAATLLAAGYFESVRFTVDDRQRAAQYQANATRTVALHRASDLGSYLESLDMEARFDPFDEAGRARITQLINKTNQFNLTTRRYSEAEVAAVERDADGWAVQVRLADRFGDNGMVRVAICSRHDATWRIDVWLMSCRVLNRRLEEQLLNVMVDAAAAEGIRRIEGTFRPTAKNRLVEDLYARLGFHLDRADADGSTWSLDVADYRPRPVPIRTVIAAARTKHCATADTD